MFPKLKIYEEISYQKCRSEGQNRKAKAWTLEAKDLNPWGQDQGNKFVSSRILEVEAYPQGLHHCV